MLNLWSPYLQEEGGEAEAVTNLKPQGGVLVAGVQAGVVTRTVEITAEREAMVSNSVAHDKRGGILEAHRQKIKGNII